jgi:hypothetical protein
MIVVVIYVIRRVIVCLVGAAVVDLWSVVGGTNLQNRWLHWQGVD